MALQNCQISAQKSSPQRFSSSRDVVVALKECSRARDLVKGRQVHFLAIEAGFCWDSYVINSLINMYGKCGCIGEAQKIFDGLLCPGVVTWTCIIQGFVDNGQNELALEYFDRMGKCCEPDARTYVVALTACAALASKQRSQDWKRRWLAKGKCLHSIVSYHSSNMFVNTSLIRMYSSCGSMIDARRVFDAAKLRDVVSWTTLLKGYVENDECEAALELFDEMRSKCSPDSRVYVVTLSACATLVSRHNLKWLEKAEVVYSEAVKSGCCNIFVNNVVIDIYAKCGRMVEARKLFESMIQRDAVTWTTMLQGYVENGQSELTLKLFGQLPSTCAIDGRTYVAVCNACGVLASGEGLKSSGGDWFLKKGEEIHYRALTSRCCDIFVENALITMYSCCGSMLHARSVFDNMVKRDVVSWTSLIQGYVENGESEVALQRFEEMQKDHLTEIDARSCVVALTACAALASKAETSSAKADELLMKGKAIHSKAIDSHCCNAFVENMLIAVYSRCGSMSLARKVFDEMKHRDIVSWTTLLQGYVEHEECELALEIFRNTDEVCDAKTYVIALTACSNLSASSDKKKDKWLEQGKIIHLQAESSGSCDIFLQNALVDMYSKSGSMVEARIVFDGMSKQNTVSWTALISGYVDNGDEELGLEIVKSMKQSSEVALDTPIFVEALKACGNTMALENGKAFHVEVLALGMENNVSLATSLVDFYGKCSNVEAAQHIFDSMFSRDIWTWNAMICGYSQQGNAQQAFRLVMEMKEQHNLMPDEVTYTHILNVCSHVGLIHRGKKYFDELKSGSLGIRPNITHYNCMIDLLGRANRIDQAMEMVRSMPFDADVVTWTTILGACRKWKNVSVGKEAYENLLRLDDKDLAGYVLMASIYGNAGDKTEAEICRSKTRWTDALGKVHRFTTA